MANQDLNELKEELNEVSTEITTKTEKFNKSIEKLKMKKQQLTTIIEKLELQEKAKDSDELFALSARLGLTIDELKDTLRKAERDGQVNIQKKVQTQVVGEQTNNNTSL